MRLMGVGEFLLHLFVCVQGMREKVRKRMVGEVDGVLERRYNKNRTFEERQGNLNGKKRKCRGRGFREAGREEISSVL